MDREISYSAAITEAFFTVMRSDKSVFQIGVGINTPWFVGNTMTGILEEFGPSRVIDTPVSENGVTGIAVGAALAGMHPILTFPRMDFMHYAMDQLFNHAGLLGFSLGGNVHIPLVIRAIINRGGEQGAQHSQALQSFFMHFPGFKVVMPSNSYDAKGMLIQAIAEKGPVIYIDDRWLYEEKTRVPETAYTVPFGKAEIINAGSALTVVSSSYLTVECKKAISIFKNDYSIELIDLRSIKPIDADCILQSVAKTKRLLIVDGTWRTGGVASEICRIVATGGCDLLRQPVEIIALPDTPAPASQILEDIYYPNADKIISAFQKMLA